MGSYRHALTWLTLLQDQPVTSECDKDIKSLCLRNQGLDTVRIGQVKQCLVNLGVPEDPSIQLAAEVTAVSSTGQHVSAHCLCNLSHIHDFGSTPKLNSAC